MGACNTTEDATWPQYEREASQVSPRRPQEALDIYQKALNNKLKANDQMKLSASIGRSYLIIGILSGHKSIQNYRQAIRSILNALPHLEAEDKRNYSLGFFFLGLFYGESKQFEKAIENMNKAHELRKDLYSEYTLEGLMCAAGFAYIKIQEDKKQEAIGIFKEIVTILETRKLEKTLDENNLADPLVYNIKMAEAEHFPTLPKLYFSIGELYLDLGNQAEAYSYFNKQLDFIKRQADDLAQFDYNKQLSINADMIRSVYLAHPETKEFLEKLISFWSGNTSHNPVVDTH